MDVVRLSQTAPPIPPRRATVKPVPTLHFNSSMNPEQTKSTNPFEPESKAHSEYGQPQQQSTPRNGKKHFFQGPHTLSSNNPFTVTATSLKFAQLEYKGETWTDENPLSFSLFLSKHAKTWKLNNLLPDGLFLRKVPQFIQDNVLRSLVQDQLNKSLPANSEFDSQFIEQNKYTILDGIFEITDAGYTFSRAVTRFNDETFNNQKLLNFWHLLWDLSWPVYPADEDDRSTNNQRFQFCKDGFMRKLAKPEIVALVMRATSFESMVRCLIEYDGEHYIIKFWSQISRDHENFIHFSEYKNFIFIKILYEFLLYKLVLCDHYAHNHLWANSQN